MIYRKVKIIQSFLSKSLTVEREKKAIESHKLQYRGCWAQRHVFIPPSEVLGADRTGSRFLSICGAVRRGRLCCPQISLGKWCRHSKRVPVEHLGGFKKSCFTAISMLFIPKCPSKTIKGWSSETQSCSVHKARRSLGGKSSSAASEAHTLSLKLSRHQVHRCWVSSFLVEWRKGSFRPL